MKKILFATALTALLGCHKTTDPGNCYPSDSYVGKWELRIQQCGWSGETTYAPGNTNTLNLNGNEQFTATGVLADTGTYQVVPWQNPQGQTVPLLKLNGSDTRQFELGLKGDSLTLDVNAFIADGCGYIYKRK
jgi:hypothetical protein